MGSIPLSWAEWRRPVEHASGGWRWTGGQPEERDLTDLDLLFDAVTQGDLPSIEAAVRADPALVGKRGGWLEQTLLHAAATCGQVAIADFLLGRGADVTARDGGDHATPLHWAAEHGHLDVAKRLVAAGADVNATDDLHRGGPLGWATTVSGVQREMAEFLISKGARASVFHAIALDDMTLLIPPLEDPAVFASRLEPYAPFDLPLHYAASIGRRSAVEVLLDRGADIDGADSNGLTPLAVAILSDHAEVARVLESRGATRGDASVSLADGSGEKAIDAMRRDAGCLEEGGRYYRALHFAAQHGHAAMAAALLDAGADPDLRLEWWPDLVVTPLHPACSYGHLAVVELLVARGADRTVEDSCYGGAPLAWAQQYDRKNVVEYLEGLEAGDRR